MSTGMQRHVSGDVDRRASQPEPWTGTQSLAASINLDEATVATPGEFMLHESRRAGSVPKQVSLHGSTTKPRLGHTAKV